MNKLKIFTAFILLLSILSMGCENNSDFSFLEKVGLNSAAWKADSFACKAYRDTSYTKIAKCKDVIVNKKDSNFIKKFFGEPSYRHGDVQKPIFVYIVEPGFFCIDSLHLDKTRPMEVAVCYFECGANGLVVRMGTSIP